MKRKTNSFLALLVLLIASFLFSSNLSIPSVSAASASITTNNSITLNASSAGNGVSIDEESIGITTTCNKGYDLTIATSTSTDLYLNGDSTKTASYTAVDGTSALDSTNNTNKWGYTTTSDASSSTVFSPLSTTATSLRTISETTDVTSETIPIYYGIKTDNTVNPGTYTMGDNGTIIYYLTMNPQCNVVDIAYDGNNADAGTMGAAGTGVIHTGVRDGDTVDLIASNFSRDGYGFAGWSLDKDAGEKLLDNGNTNNPIVYGPQETITIPEGFADNDTDNDGIVKLYAVWLQSQGNLQGWVGCSDLDTATYDSTTGALDLTKNSVTALTDQRDNDTYAIAKLADGKCWMIENLRLDNSASLTLANTNNPLNDGTNVTLKHSYSDTETHNTLSASQDPTTTAWCQSDSASCDDQSMLFTVNTTNRASSPTANGVAMHSYGNYYNWYSATAGRGTYGFSTNNNSVAGDLCPAGWHLPKGGNKSNEANNEFWSLVVTGINGGTNPANYESSTQPNYTGTPEGNDASSKLRAYPNNFVYSGGVFGGSVYSRGSFGYFWSSTAYSSSNAYYLFLYSSSVTPGTSNNVKYYGGTVRCVASDPQTYTLSYDANGGTGAPNSPAPIYANGSATFTISNTTPTRSGYTFAGWTDEKGNETQPNASFTTKNPSTTLYAIWTNNSCNPTATTIGTGNATDAVCLQDVTLSMKASLPTATASTGTYTLIDARDNQNYTIAKLPDGELWMTKNLNYSSTNLNTSHDTDLSSSTFRLPQSTTASSTDDTAVTIRTTNNSGNNNNGTYYSWPAAVASTVSYSGGNVTSSICPKGWDLPISAHYTNLKTKANYKTGNLTTSAPSSFLVNGGFTNGATFYQTSYSHFWTGTTSTSSAAYGARVGSTTMGTNPITGTTDGGNKYYRKNIRCIASNGTATVNYNANGGTGNMASQTNVDINSTTVSSNSFSAPANSQFKNWNTSANGTGTTVDANTLLSSIASAGDTITLYAQWDELYYISFNANESSVGSTAGSATGTMANQTVIRDTATSIRSNTFALTGYIFYGWNTAPDGSGTTYSDGQKVTNLASTGNTITLYAIWTNGAYLDTGQNVNQKLKRLAGNSSATYSTQDITITAIVRSNTLPNNFTATADNTISHSSSPSDIYAWYDSTSTTIYYYSEATTILMNKTSSCFFYNMRALSNLATISTWDTTKVTNISYMFYYTGYNATTFNTNLSSWNTSSVTTMNGMFSGAGYSATTWSIGDLSSWNTSSVTTMNSMFSDAGYSASTWSVGDLSSWNTSSVTTMNSMFWRAGYSATTWSIGNLSSWNTSNVTEMSQMFWCAGYSATTFNLNLSSWGTSNVTNMVSMFKSAGYSATTWSIGNLSSWNTSNVTNMGSMFAYAGYSASTWSVGDLSSWNTSSATNMSDMFAYAGYSATTFNLNLSSWNTSGVTNMSGMFSGAGYSATTWSIGDLSSWNTSSVTNVSGMGMVNMFCYAGHSATTWSIGDLSSWNTSGVTNMSNMFREAGYSATTFNLNLSSWDTSNVTRTDSMFSNAGYSATTFNLNLSSWNTSGVTNMSDMFAYAGYNATTWSITIPKTNNGTATGPISNTTSNLYGNSTSVTATPPSGKSFTLAN